MDSLSRENMKNLHEIMQSFRFSNVRNAIATNLNIDFGQKRSNFPTNAVFLIAKFFLGVLLVIPFENLPRNCSKHWIILNLLLLGNAQPRTGNYLQRPRDSA